MLEALLRINTQIFIDQNTVVSSIFSFFLSGASWTHQHLTWSLTWLCKSTFEITQLLCLPLNPPTALSYTTLKPSVRVLSPVWLCPALFTCCCSIKSSCSSTTQLSAPHVQSAVSSPQSLHGIRFSSYHVKSPFLLCTGASSFED